MVVKEKKMTVTKRSAKAEDDADSILSRLQTDNDFDVLTALKDHLAPVCKLAAIPDKENISMEEKRRIAKQFVPFLAQTLKVCSNGLAKVQVSAETICVAKADQFFKSMELALDCFEYLRDSLIGAPYEIEMQRSWLVRRLIAWRKFQEALDQDIRLLQSLNSRAFHSGTKHETIDLNKGKFNLCHPHDAKESVQELIVLIVGAATDLIVCAAELGSQQISLLELVYDFADQLEPWLCVLDAEKSAKQRSLIFKELHKCVMICISKCSHPAGIHKLVSLVLYECAMSTINDHFCKVVKNICSKIISAIPNSKDMAIAVYEEALKKIRKTKQLQNVGDSFEVVELIDCYARICQTAKRNQDGWHQILETISEKNVQDVFSMISVAGLYAVSLVLDADISESFACKVCDILQKAIHAVQKMFTLSGVQSANETHPGNQDIVMVDLDTRNFVRIYRMLDFFRRSASSYAQLQWDAFISMNGRLDALPQLISALESCLLFFCKSITHGLRYNGLSNDESDLFHRGSKSFFPAASAALKLSLIRQNGQKECIMLIRDSISDSFVGLDELRWLMSSAYNMGVQLFNLKLHKLACDPFRVSYMAAWARISQISNHCHVEGDDSSRTEEISDFIDIITDACTKTSVFVDTLTRSNDFEGARKVFQQSLERWADNCKMCLKRSFPHSLLQLWLKKVFSMHSSEDFRENMICSIVFDFNPSLPKEAAALLLEEERLFYESLEESEPSIALQIEGDILNLLLDKIYVGNSFPSERAKILAEKGRIHRFTDLEDNECLLCLTDAINTLVAWMEVEVNDCGQRKAFMELQLGIYHLLRAICSHEADPSSKGFLEDIQSGLNLLEGYFLSCKVLLKQEQPSLQVQIMSLLQNVADMLSLKGYLSLQYRVYALLLEIASSSSLNSEDKFLSVFTNRKLSHVFCSSPFVHALPKLLKEKLALYLDSIESLEKLLKKLGKGTFSILFRNILTFFSRCCENTFSDGYFLLGWEDIIRELKEPKGSNNICSLSQAFFMVAESNKRRGKLQEALHNAKEALQLRLKLLNRCFKITEKAVSEGVDASKKDVYLKTLGCVAVNVWPSMNLKKHESGPSQWQILGDYLESLMQVGSINQMLGMIDDAENSFEEGFQIAVSHSLLFAEGVFSSCLGEVQRKKHSWQMAEASLENARQLWNNAETELFCHHCRQTAEAILSYRIADLECHRNDRSPVNSGDIFDTVMVLYQNAEEKLCSLMIGYKLQHELCLNRSHLCQDDESSILKVLQQTSHGDFEHKKACDSDSSRAFAKSADHLPSSGDNEFKLVRSSRNSYRTRSKVAAATKKRDVVDQLCIETNVKLAIHENNIRKFEKDEAASKKTQKQKKSRPKQKTELDVDVENPSVFQEFESLANMEERIDVVDQCHDRSKRHPKFCFCQQNAKVQFEKLTLDELLNHQWDIQARSLMVRVLIQKGKIFKNLRDVHSAYKEFSKALSVLKHMSPVLSGPAFCRMDCITLGVVAHYPIEESCLLYHISMLELSQESCTVLRASEVSSWLNRAFLLCRETPPLLSKVARILAILSVPKDMGGPFGVSVINGILPCKSASYFHELSLGATTRQKHLTVLDAKERLATKTPQETSLKEGIEQVLRMQPFDMDSLKSVIEKDIDLPCPAICLSLVDQEMLTICSHDNDLYDDAWLMVTRFDTGLRAVSMILRCPVVPEGNCPYTPHDPNELVEAKKRPAFGSLVGKLTTILDESRLSISTSGMGSLNSVEEKCRWWEWRMDLDVRLASLLRTIEECWLGPWKSLLLGNLCDKTFETFRRTVDDVKRQLECLNKPGSLNSDLITLLLHGLDVLTRTEIERGVAWLLGQIVPTFISTPGNTEKMESAVNVFLESFDAVTQTGSSHYESAVAKKAGLQKNILQQRDGPAFQRGPVVLVLDANLQVFPWESLPVLRQKEVYRMPSLSAIRALVIHRSFHETMKRKQISSKCSKVTEADQYPSAYLPTDPSVNPHDAYFLLNPSGDLGSTQIAFEDMFRSQPGWQGKIGEIPSIEEYMDGLQTHELFVYLGHGSGDQYLPERRMRKIQCCAAALLMGCSSGRLMSRGDYEPVGVPLSYLMAGCPTIIANLWDVTDGDIDRFSRVLLCNWLETETEPVTAGTAKNTRSKEPKRLDNRAATRIEPQDRLRRTATHIGDGRDACKLPYLIGASPVCYGIPTRLIRRKP